MQPIVNRLEELYDNEIAFIALNAADDDTGQAAFESIGLPGHPSYVIFRADGTEHYRGFGLLGEEQLIEAIESVTSD